MSDKEIMDRFMEYGEKITYYYEIVSKRCIKRKYNEKKGMRYLNKLDEWELQFEENLCNEVGVSA